jgi:ribosomal protein L6P/L9E
MKIKIISCSNLTVAKNNLSNLVNIDKLTIDSNHSHKRLKKIVIPKGVACYFRHHQIQVTGPLGTLYLNIDPLKKSHPTKTSSTDTTRSKNILIPTYHRLVLNAIQGVYYGYILKLRVKGSGYKIVNCSNGQLTLRLGHSHLCRISIPKHIQVICNRFQQILCYSISKDRLHKFGDKLKKMRKRNPYRAKGVFEVSEPTPNKAPGKAGRKKA